MGLIKYRKITGSDKKEIDQLMRVNWGSEQVVVHNSKYTPSNLQGFIAEENGIITGVITYNIDNDSCEIVTLDSMKENCGIGTALINLVKEEAKENRCSLLWLITTNDNLNAISFYEKRGFKLKQVFPGAVDQSRKIKPEIPLFAPNGIPIKDELKFIMEL